MLPERHSFERLLLLIRQSLKLAMRLERVECSSTEAEGRLVVGGVVDDRRGSDTGSR